MENQHMLHIHKILAIGVCVLSLLFVQVGLNGRSTTASEPAPLPQPQLFSASEPVRTILDPAPDSHGLSKKTTEKPLLAAGSKNFGIALFFLGCLAHEDS